jgi:hypothetical protein
VAEFEARPHDPLIPDGNHSRMTYERAHLKAMQGYVPGEQPDTPAIKLNTNENPYPPGPAVARALSSFSLEMLQRYSGSACRCFPRQRRSPAPPRSRKRHSDQRR